MWRVGFGVLATGFACNATPRVEPDPTGGALSAPTSPRAVVSVEPPRAEPSAKGFAGAMPLVHAPATKPGALRAADGSIQVWQEGEPPVLWVARGDGGAARVLFDPRKVKADGDISTGITVEGEFDALTFAPDAAKVFFLTHGWVMDAEAGEQRYVGGATSRSLFSVETKTGRARHVLNANSFLVIDRCKDPTLVGDIAAYVHTYDTLPTSAYDWFILVDDRGKRIGDIDQQQNLDRFLAKRCGLGEPPPDPPRIEAEALRKAAAACPSDTVEYKPLELLDGTTLDLFVLHGKKPNEGTGAGFGLQWLQERCH